MSAFKLLGLAALAAAAPVEERAKKPKSFLKDLGNLERYTEPPVC